MVADRTGDFLPNTQTLIDNGAAILYNETYNTPPDRRPP